MKTIISRKDAKTAGLKKYFTGKSCKNGHIASRYVCNSECIECEAIRKSKKVSSLPADKMHVVSAIDSTPKTKIREVVFQKTERRSRNPIITSDRFVQRKQYAILNR